MSDTDPYLPLGCLAPLERMFVGYLPLGWSVRTRQEANLRPGFWPLGTGRWRKSLIPRRDAPDFPFPYITKTSWGA